MHYSAGSSNPAAALIAAAILLLAGACGSGDDDDSSPSASPSPPGDGSPVAPRGVGPQELAAAERVVRITGDTNDDLLTGSHSLALGDFNDDGDPDLLVGASQADGRDDSRPDSGEAYILFGPLNGERELGTGHADITYFGGSSGDNLGYAVLAADINGDDTDDVIIGAPGVTAGFDPRTDQGRAYVFFGGSELGETEEVDLIEEAFDFTVTGAEGFSRLGAAMAAGDVNGDGTRDLVIGAPFAGRAPGSAPGSERTAVGEAYVVFGGDGLSGEKNVAILEHDVLISGAHAFGEFAASVATADINGDDRDDVIVGASRSDLGDQARAGSGGAYVFFGREDFPRRLSVQDGEQDLAILGPVASAFGSPITAGDFNGDGTADFAVGARLEGTPDLQGRGTVRILLGDDSLPETLDLAAESADITTGGQMTSEFMPSGLAAVDLDGDGTDELVIGSLLFNPADDRFGAGAVYVITVGPDAPPEISVQEDALTLLGEAAGDRLGNVVRGGAIAEGIAGFAVLAPGDYPNNQEDDGIVYLVRPAP